ncbi:heterokaryon incompatibility protein-domain-containing protein [Dactylonectria macrodidyma]|uniref:Heterokaryon incompatibility protein-domain-containing protein n=1 Tax=Dactylonectria macrodidyma TaxID=307937 RepID=A0A9P9JS33_9HYPO|nr:heterokaryon incompatibility protein-domain-containing protein [Dactylonectria macrodidyma]
MASLTKYEYKAIEGPQTIRLIHVHPGNETDPVQLSLVTTSLDKTPAFEAISYCWGDVQDLREVICDGVTLSITNSLFTGLVHFRRPGQPRVLWADAVCINQADAVEKNQQVLMMAGIYSRATRVLVWLGVADDPLYGSVSSDVVSSIRKAAQLLPDFDPEDSEEMNLKSQMLRRETKRLREEGKPNVLDHDWMPLAALLARPWFRRKWIVQEVSVARNCVLYAGGGVEIPWLELAQLSFKMEGMGVERFLAFDLGKRYGRADMTRQNDGHPGSEGHDDEVKRKKVWSSLDPLFMSLHCATSLSMVQIYRGRGTLLDGVITTKFFRCSDPRDHIYSLLSLGAKGPTVQPDYGALASDIFRRFTITMLVEGRSLKVLSLAPDRAIFEDPNTPRLEGLPSWVPDLRLMRDDVLVSYTVRPQAFFAGGHTKPIVSVSEDERVLGCKGQVVDAIGTLSTSMIDALLADLPEIRFSWEPVSDPSPDRRRKRFARWLKDCYELAFGNSYGSEDAVDSNTEPMQAFSRTMLCGIDFMRNRLSPDLIATFPTSLKWAIDYGTNEDSELAQRHPSMSLSYSTTIDQSIQAFFTLKFCVTQNDRFARVPIHSRAGDCICVLGGGEVPFVIRPTGRGTYTLIGECYVDGIMDGEALGEVAATPELLETIYLE